MNERNVAKNIRLVFSTGRVIDSLKVSVKVKNPLTNKPMMDVSVGLYVYSDTLNPKKIKPYYFMKTDSSGIFTIENVATGKYRIYAVTDVNNNLLYDEAKENLGIITDTITLKLNLENLEINVARMEKIPNKVLKARTTSSISSSQTACDCPSVNTRPWSSATSTIDSPLASCREIGRAHV